MVSDWERRVCWSVRRAAVRGGNLNLLGEAPGSSLSNEGTTQCQERTYVHTDMEILIQNKVYRNTSGGNACNGHSFKFNKHTYVRILYR